MILDDRPVIDQLTEPLPWERVRDEGERILLRLLDDAVPDELYGLALQIVDDLTQAAAYGVA